MDRQEQRVPECRQCTSFAGFREGRSPADGAREMLSACRLTPELHMPGFDARKCPCFMRKDIG